jgi:hypothetical protein
MKIKDVHVGEKYTLTGCKHSTPGASLEFFKILADKEVHVVSKLNNFNNKNTICIQGIVPQKDKFIAVSFWCSPYDLRQKKTR